ncbi:uncharacterized protein LOC142302450 [Anomaloglossus baeobatrachus]|uniref:uncharacterized protein LOC142302450 n=1 Tax=Anomaloglossus baeobatrachus TaxID=238106 RepID=UPI003F4F5714
MWSFMRFRTSGPTKTPFSLLLSTVSETWYTEMCSDPSDLNITNVTAIKFLVGTQLSFTCDPEYYVGNTNQFHYDCVNYSHVIRWKSKNCYCRNYACLPLSVINAQLDLSESSFPVGQELHYIYQCDNPDNSRAHGVLRCQLSGGSVDWIKLSDECMNTNDGSHGKGNRSHPVEETKCTGGGFVSCVSFAIGVISVIVVIWTIFKIAQWRIKSTGKAKFLQRNTESGQKEEEVNAARVPLTEKL